MNPAAVDLSSAMGVGESEYRLPSGDSIDVVFAAGARLAAVEVKSASSDVVDIVRGLFQCVKYEAVLTARARFEQQRVTIGVRLALGGQLPESLIPLRNSLGVRVIEGVQPSDTQ